MKQTNNKLSGFINIKRAIAVFILIILTANFVAAQRNSGGGKVNPNPNCGGSDLCVEWAPDNAARDEYRSDFFYAVILKTTAKCAATEKERLKFQVLFPKNKVFLEEAACNDDAEKRNSYSGIGDDKHSFIAVYAGATKAEAEKFLQIVKATKKFPGANVRRTQVVVAGT